MKKKLMYIVSLLLVMLIASPVGTFAQDQGWSPTFSPAELDQMLAPIALYPDSLLAQILMAATYPLEVVMADRWVKAHPHLSGDQVQREMDYQTWDPSVKALVSFPQVLAMMSERLEWTEKVGDAFLDQQEEVMDRVQKLREQARAAGNLKSTREQRVVVRERIIVIESANPEVVYVPVYNPAIVYGRWWYPDYPPYWYYPPGYVVTRVVFAFPFFYAVGPAWPFAWGYWDWPHHAVYVNVDRSVNINRTYVSRTDIRTTAWQHDASHRRGVPYRSEPIRERYTPTKGSADSRRDFRGFDQEVKTAPKVSSVPPIVQQPQPSGVSVSKRPTGSKVSGAPPTTQQPQRADSKKPEASKVSSKPPTIQQLPPSGSSGSKTPVSSKVSSGPSIIQQPQGSGSKSLAGSKDKTVFGGMDRGTDVKKQSERGVQSRGSTITGGVGSSGSSHGGGLSGGGPGVGKGSSGGSGQQNGGKGGSGGSGPSGGDRGGSKAKDDIRR